MLNMSFLIRKYINLSNFINKKILKYIICFYLKTKKVKMKKRKEN